MATTINTNLVTSENVHQMKMIALKNYGIGNVCSDYLERVNMVTSLFDYESEELETIVFGFVLSEADRWINEAAAERKRRYSC